ncbi:hypothetical protein OIU74_009420 [Salix koriyanagi]|uniref:Uncharacterized protein n=1 Tax=Salix koriyanagi TaxID=2511006 RepID=A0A9Q0TSC4_9ROSI|nr:hypothetical protein OIU74_009420 [Salix koriyanagi]
MVLICKRNFSEEDCLKYLYWCNSLNDTVGNSSIVRRTIKDLMAVIHPYISILVGPEPESVNEFISSVTGRTSDVRKGESEVKPDSPCLLNGPSTNLLTGIDRKRLNAVKRAIQSLVAALFCIILHVQGPLISYGAAMGSDRDNGPDLGAVILIQQFFKSNGLLDMAWL